MKAVKRRSVIVGSVLGVCFLLAGLMTAVAFPGASGPVRLPAATAAISAQNADSTCNSLEVALGLCGATTTTPTTTGAPSVTTTTACNTLLMLLNVSASTHHDHGSSNVDHDDVDHDDVDHDDNGRIELLGHHTAGGATQWGGRLDVLLR